MYTNKNRALLLTFLAFIFVSNALIFASISNTSQYSLDDTANNDSSSVTQPPKMSAEPNIYIISYNNPLWYNIDEMEVEVYVEDPDGILSVQISFYNPDDTVLLGWIDMNPHIEGGDYNYDYDWEEAGNYPIRNDYYFQVRAIDYHAEQKIVQEYYDIIHPSEGADIYIDDSETAYNWAQAKNNGYCSGSGTPTDPYLITEENLVSFDWKAIIHIRNSDAYFKIIDLNEDLLKQIYLHNTNNGLISNCVIEYIDGMGIQLEKSSFNTISYCSITHNEGTAIGLFDGSNNNNIINNDLSYNDGHGMVLYDYNNKNNIINNNFIENAGYAIDLELSSENIIDNNIMLNNGEKGIFISLWSDKNLITNNIIDSNGDCQIIVALYNQLNTISNNIIRNSESGEKRAAIVVERDSHHINIFQNEIYDCEQDGIYLDSTQGNVVKENTIYNIGGTGLYLDSSDYNILTDNIVENCECGIHLDDCSNISITGNAVDKTSSLGDNSVGILIENSDYLNITDNFITDTIQGIQNGIGMAILGCYHFNIQNNIIDNTDGGYTAGIGIYIDQSDEGYSREFTVKDNIITNTIGGDFGMGIYLHFCAEFILENNKITHSKGFVYGIGISLVSSFGCIISKNNCSYNGIKRQASSGAGIAVKAEFGPVRNIHIIENIVRNNFEGIYLENCEFSEIRANDISKNEKRGIILAFSDDNQIIENTITDNLGPGIYIIQSENNEIRDNIIINNGDDCGIELESSNNNIISGNFISENEGDGITLKLSDNTIIKENILNANEFSGVSLEDSNDNSISDNIISNNPVGIDLDSSNNNFLQENDFSGNEDDFIEENSEGNIIENNIFILSPIIINDEGGGDFTWAEAVLEDWCSGSGTEEDPYVIDGLLIDGGNVESCLTIEKSNVSFIVENCKFINSGINEAGIKLSKTKNGQIINTNCSLNEGHGILLEKCKKIIIQENSITHNDQYGVYLEKSNKNQVTENLIDYNYQPFIEIKCNENIIENNQ